MQKRGQWGSRVGFILAAIGSAVGLGNIWRFPYTVASNGGGAFLIPYLIALLTAGIPLMILEFGLGQKLRTSAPGIFGKLNKKWEAFGWWQSFIAFVITTYYVVIVAWAMSYIIYGFQLAWGSDPASFFYSYLGITDSPLEFGGLRSNVLFTLLIIWAINITVILLGVKKGIERANKIFMPLLFISMIVITLRGLTLPGALDGLDFLFAPDFSKILSGKVWIAAYGQVFMSLSICFGIMLVYSGYLPKKSDIVNNAFITAFGNCSFSLLAGIAVFSILGYMAHTQALPVSEVAGNGGIGLAFVVFPQALASLPGLNGIFGALFFICLVFAGLSSSISIVENVVMSVSDKFNMGRTKAIIITCSIMFVCSLLFVTGSGLYLLDIVDHFINSYGVAVAGLIEAILIGWFFNLESIRNYVNPISDFQVGKWWNICIKFVTPLLLGIMSIASVINDINNPYEGYPLKALMIFGVLLLVATIIGAFILSNVKGSKVFEDHISEGVDFDEF